MLSRLSARLAVTCLLPAIVFFVASVVSESGMAAGVLSRVRNQVRSESSPSEDHRGDDDDDDHDHSTRRPRRRRRCYDDPCYSAPHICWTSDFYSPPQRIVEYHVIEHPVVTSPDSVSATRGLPQGALADPFMESVPPPVPDVGRTIGGSPPRPREPVFHEPWSDDWSFRLSAFYGHDFQDLSQANLSALWQLPGSLGVETSATTFRESWDQQRDHLWIGDVNLVFETFHVGATRVRLGFGLNWLADSLGADVGLNLTAGFDMPIAPRWTLSGEADIGSLGAADFWHGQLSLGRQFSRAEWMLGLDHYNIGGVQLHGVFTGLRFRF